MQLIASDSFRIVAINSLLLNAPMARWRKLLFIYMSRNAWNATSFFKLPRDRVIELGNHVEL